MYLKSLEIQGFKSFPDKISLTFDKGLTAVVGPNGSGKSNIGDSVRWVLGEQSTKTLRGNKMEDVIFSGTVTRKPMGFAAVTLNIDNSDGTLAELGEEVAVTRKLYRSGESEYKINGRECRLKDINELFMDTGLGRDGYSIIGQGRIAEIVGAKSSDRRDIFEEAAGISKIRYKKLEAERKLVASQENLIRLSDILSELEIRIEPLRVQSEKAQKFIKLAEERKHLEVSVWVTRLDELKTKLENLNENILIKRAEYENTENDIAREEEKIQKCYRRMQECTAHSDELRRKMIEEEQDASKKKSNIAVFENDISHCSENILRVKKSIADSEEIKRDLQLKIKETEKKIDVLENQKAVLADEISAVTAEFERAENKNSQLGDSVDKAGSEINSLYIKQSELNFSAQTAKQQAIDEERRLHELLSSIVDVENTLKGYNEKLREETAEFEKNSCKKEEAKNKLNGIEKLYSLRREGFEQTKSDIEKTIYDLRNAKQKMKLLLDLENNMEGFAGSVKQVLKASKQGRLSGICGTVAQNISVDGQYALAVETALGGAMQNIIVENEESAKRSIRFLKDRHAGRATFLPITSVRGYNLNESGIEKCMGFVAYASHIVKYDAKFGEIIKSLLGRIVIAEDIDSATAIAKKYGYKFRIVTLDGQVINTGGSFTGGSAQKSTGVFTRKNEINELNLDIAQFDKTRESLSIKLEKLRTETEKLRYDREMARSELAEYESTETRISAEISSLKVLIEQLKSSNENIIRQQVELKKRIESSKQAEAKALEEAGHIDEEIKIVEKRLSAGQDIREKLRIERAELSEKLSGLKISNAELLKDIQVQLSEIDRIKLQLKETGSDSRYYVEEIEQQNRIIAQKRRDIERLSAELENLEKNFSEYTNQINHLQDVHTEQNRLVNQLQKSMKQFNEAKEKLSGEITRLEEHQESANRDSDNIVHQLMDIYEMTVSEAVQNAEKISDISSAQAKLDGVKNKIKNLGSVNVDAVEEYREVSERYEFMSAQIADVQKSKKELEKIISDLTEDMCCIFAESFEIINSNFKHIFKELFGGGKAELILTDPDDVLGSGIEISVAPPGKVIKNLISLSGGEQSFVAIAIYFAILKLRPAPFCILDEIDAALDEVNVRKYAQYLKKFTDTTQFVLVTHRRSAMEEANVLYGVTMQEDGISKLLKMEQVDFQDETADIK